MKTGKEIVVGVILASASMLALAGCPRRDGALDQRSQRNNKAEVTLVADGALD